MTKVKVFSANWCPYCIKVKDYLKAKGIQFEEVDLDRNPEAGQELIEISGQTGIPVVVIDNKVIIGFDTRAIDSALEEK